MNYEVYILKSLANRWFYGVGTNNIYRRLKEHNLGKVRSTKTYRPFELVFVQITFSKEESVNLEKYLKVHYNKEALLNLILPMW